jgi:hypothetical protein
MLTIIQTYAHGFIFASMLDIYINLFRVYTYTMKVNIYMGSREILRTIQYALIVSALPTMKLAYRETRQDLKGARRLRRRNLKKWRRTSERDVERR